MLATLFLSVVISAAPSHLMLVIEHIQIAPGCPPLSDARRFGVQPEAARFHWRLAESHFHTMRAQVETNNPLQTCNQWENEVAWRARAWCLLDDVLYCTFLPPKRRAESLRDLRLHIGPLAYELGAMPVSTPHYRQ